MEGSLCLINKKVYLNVLTIVLFREYIFGKKQFANSDNMEFWKLNVVKEKNIVDQNISTKDNIVQKLIREEMEFHELF
jgi:hypothetical protein